MTIVLIAALVSVVMGFVFALVESALGRVTRHRVVALADEVTPAVGSEVLGVRRIGDGEAPARCAEIGTHVEAAVAPDARAGVGVQPHGHGP